MDKIISVLKTMRAGSATKIIFHKNHPDSLVYENAVDGKKKKITLTVDTVDQFRLDVSGINGVEFSDESGNTAVEYPSNKESLIDELIFYYESLADNELDEDLNRANSESAVTVATPVAPTMESQTAQPPVSGPDTNDLGVSTEPPKEPNFVSEPDKDSDDDSELYKKLIQDVHLYMSHSTTMKISINNNGNFIDQGQFVSRPNSSKRVKSFLKYAEFNAYSGLAKDLMVGKQVYRFELVNLGDYSCLDVYRVVDEVDAPLQANKTVKNLVELKDVGGMILSTSDSIVLLEPVLQMLKSTDPKAEENLIAVGNCFPAIYKVPYLDDNEIPYSRIKKSSFRYVFINTEKKVNMEEVLDLILCGKVVILGYQSSTLYGLTTRFSIASESNHLIKRSILLSINCFINPKLSMSFKGGKINGVSLAETEIYNMNFQRAMEIEEDKLTLETFNRRIEYPAKIYQLNKESSTISQEEEFVNLLRNAVENEASDIFIVAGSCIKVRINRGLVKYNKDVIIPPEVSKQVMFILTDENKRTSMEVKGFVDCSYSVPGLGRFRVHICVQRDTYAVVIRPVKFGVPTAEEMNIPKELSDAIVERGSGMVITTGATGMGKSTTNAILVSMAYDKTPVSLVSLGDPIEYLYQHKEGVVIQREIPTDSPNFEYAMESIFRSNPNIIEVGEIRTKESVEIALRLASSGHLFFATLHTGSIMSTISSILNRSDQERRGEVLESLSESLTAIINQILIRDVHGNLIPVFEYLIIDDYSKTCLRNQDLLGLEKHIINEANSNDSKVARIREVELKRMLDHNLISETTYRRYCRDSAKEEERRQNGY